MDHQEKGFTLIELMLAAAVVIIALLGIMSANLVTERHSEAAFERTLAMQDANRAVEELRDAANTGSSQNFQTDVQNAVTTVLPTIVSLPASHNEQIAVSYVDVNADPLDVTVTVTWNEQGLRATSVSLRTLITKRT